MADDGIWVEGTFRAGNSAKSYRFRKQIGDFVIAGEVWLGRRQRQVKWRWWVREHLSGLSCYGFSPTAFVAIEDADQFIQTMQAWIDQKSGVLDRR